MKRGVLDARVTLAAVGFLYLAVGAASFAYSPSYLQYGWVWGLLGLAASTATWLTMIGRSVALGVWSGALAVAAAAARSAAIAAELMWSPPVSGEQQVSFAVAAVTWAVVSMLILSAWAHVVVPWCWRRVDAGPD